MARPKRGPLYPRIAEFRRRSSLTQEQVAERVGISAEMVRKHEKGLTLPIRSYRDRYCALFDVSEDALWPLSPGAGLVAPVSGRVFPHQATGALLVPGTTAENTVESTITSIHKHINSIIELDNQFGGTDLFRLSVRFFKSLRHQVGSDTNVTGSTRELIAATGELAEVAGWLAYDAEEHELVRSMNQEALYFTRLAGDRSMELLTSQNASMHAAAIGRPTEALLIARSVLEQSQELSSRLRSLFLVRKARAFAMGGDESALRILEEARTLFYDGTVPSDPPWAWWIDERELAWQEAMALRDLGYGGRALERFQHSVAAGPSTGVRSQYIHQSYLLRAQAEVGDWSAIEGSAEEMESLISDVASTRTVVLLRSVVERYGGAGSAPKKVQEALGRLGEQISLAPL